MSYNPAVPRLVDNLIVGRRTFELMKAGDDFEKMNLKNLVVISKSPPIDSSFNAAWMAAYMLIAERR